MRILPSPDGKLLASVTGTRSEYKSPDGTRTAISWIANSTIIFWDVATGKELRRLEADDKVSPAYHSRQVNDFIFSKDGTLLIAGVGDQGIRAWDVATGMAAVWGSTDDACRLCQERLKHKQTAHNWYLLAKAHGDNAGITALAFSADAKYFASGGSDGTIRMWKADGAELYAFIPEKGVKQCHEDAVTALHFTPQSRLISAGRDKTLRVWLLKEMGAAPDRKAIYNRDGNVARLFVGGGAHLEDQLKEAIKSVLNGDKPQEPKK